MAETFALNWVQALLALPPVFGYSPVDCESVNWSLSALVLLFCVVSIFLVCLGCVCVVGGQSELNAATFSIWCCVV